MPSCFFACLAAWYWSVKSLLGKAMSARQMSKWLGRYGLAYSHQSVARHLSRKVIKESHYKRRYKRTARSISKRDERRLLSWILERPTYGITTAELTKRLNTGRAPSKQASASGCWRSCLIVLISHPGWRADPSDDRLAPPEEKHGASRDIQGSCHSPCHQQCHQEEKVGLGTEEEKRRMELGQDGFY